MRYRILYKMTETEKDANKLLRDIENKNIASSPYVIQSETTKRWLVILYECKTYERAEQAVKHYLNKGYESFIQKVEK